MKEKRLILNSQKTIAFDLIALNKLNVTDFAWDETASVVRTDTTVSRIRHKESDFYFIFDHGRDSPYGSHYYERSPGETSMTDRGYPGGWELQETAFREWISYLKREIDSPDPWLGISGHNELESVFADSPLNDPLTKEESEKVANAIADFRAYLREREELDEARWNQIDEKLNLIITSSTTIRRKEWILLALGGLVSIFTSGVFAPEQSANYFNHGVELLRTALTQLKLLTGR